MIYKHPIRLLLLVFVLFISSGALFAQVISLTTERGGVSNDGRIKLIWTASGDSATYETQQATDSAFAYPKIIYQGSDRASFISGLENGTYYYRVRSENSAWSKTLTVTVQHHSLKLAWVLFALGAVVFLLTVWVVIKGSLTSTNPDS